MARAHTAPSKELVEGRRRLDAWRQTRKTRAMPEDLWALAARLGARHGVSPTARALGLRYGALRARVDAARRPAPPRFVEVGPAPPGPACRVELEDGHGARMRVDLAPEAWPVLEALGRLFLGRRA